MRKHAQAEFGFTNWGGPRDGAGRKPRGALKRVEHAGRSKQAARTPAHVTVRLVSGLPSLRTRTHHRVVVEALLASSKQGFRVTHYTVLSNHLHLICESADERALSRGMQGLAVRLARRLNRQWRRTGTVFADRYHVHLLTTPREVRNALTYVLENARKHKVPFPGRFDPYSSARWSDTGEHSCFTNPFPRPRTWLLEKGWRRQSSAT